MISLLDQYVPGGVEDRVLEFGTTPTGRAAVGTTFRCLRPEPWYDRVHRVTATADDAPAPALLIRPDGYVAWAGADPDSLKTALTRWFSPD